MSKYKTIDSINKFELLIQKINSVSCEPLTKEEEFDLCNFELELAKNLINDFDKEFCRRMAKVILTMVD